MDDKQFERLAWDELGRIEEAVGALDGVDVDLADGILEGDVIECSLHFGAFNVRTGKAVQAPCFVDLKTFRTEVRDGQVCVDLSTPAAEAS